VKNLFRIKPAPEWFIIGLFVIVLWGWKSFLMWFGFCAVVMTLIIVTNKTIREALFKKE